MEPVSAEDKGDSDVNTEPRSVFLRVAVTDLPVRGRTTRDGLPDARQHHYWYAEWQADHEFGWTIGSVFIETLNYITRPGEKTVVELMSRRMVVCNVQCTVSEVNAVNRNAGYHTVM
jgi:hypothetical protein